MRKSLQSLVQLRTDTMIRSFNTANAFLSAIDELEAGVVLLDVEMPGVTGMEALGKIVRHSTPFQVIMITGHAKIAMAVEAMRSGAFDFLEKPCDHRMLVQVIERAYVRLESAVQDQAGAEIARARLSSLSAREREVLTRLIDGMPNKVIAHELHLSTRTVEYYRANVMAKLGVRTLSEALRIAFAGEMIARDNSSRAPSTGSDTTKPPTSQLRDDS
jgi:two-component system response regulator FixJ